MKMGTTPMSPASPPCPAIRAWVEKPPNLLRFFLARASWQFPKSDPRRRKPLFASFFSATLKCWQQCRWAEHPQSSPGADYVSPICRAPLLPLEPRGRNTPTVDNLSRFLWPWIHPGGYMTLVWKGTCVAELLRQGSGESPASIPARVSLATPAPASLTHSLSLASK